MKLEYEIPSVKLIFDSNDIITTSYPGLIPGDESEGQDQVW